MDLKKIIRKKIMKDRSQLSEEMRLEKSHRIFLKVIDSSHISHANIIASFVDFRNEVSTDQLNNWILDQSKTLALPRIDPQSKKMFFHKVSTLESLIVSDYGIREPDPEIHPLVDPETFDVILTPGVGFDTKGSRLGYGGGYYDRLFECVGQAVPKIAIGFELQFIEELPVSSHDYPITHLITEAEIRHF